MSRQVTIQTKLQNEAIVTKILKEVFKFSFYFREAGNQRIMSVDTAQGRLDFIVEKEGFLVCEKEERLEPFRPFLNKLQQQYSLESIKQLAAKAGYSIGTIQQGEKAELILEVSK